MEPAAGTWKEPLICDDAPDAPWLPPGVPSDLYRWPLVHGGDVGQPRTTVRHELVFAKQTRAYTLGAEADGKVVEVTGWLDGILVERWMRIPRLHLHDELEIRRSDAETSKSCS